MLSSAYCTLITIRTAKRKTVVAILVLKFSYFLTFMGHSTGTDKFLSAQEYHSQMVFFCLNLTSLIIFQGHDVIAVINIPNLKCLI